MEVLAGAANFSRYHFHRIFSAMAGETLTRHIQRVRAEKAATKLIGNPGKTITEIAFECGFMAFLLYAGGVMRFSLVSAALLIFLTVTSSGGIIHVPGNQPTIQEGIDAALGGDTVLVADRNRPGRRFLSESAVIRAS